MKQLFKNKSISYLLLLLTYPCFLLSSDSDFKYGRRALGMFANALNQSVRIYVNKEFYKTVEPRTEIILPGINEFEVYLSKGTFPNQQHITRSTKGELGAYFYAWMEYNEDEDEHFMMVERFQNMALNNYRPVNEATQSRYILGQDVIGLLQKKLALIKKFNNE